MFVYVTLSTISDKSAIYIRPYITASQYSGFIGFTLRL